MRANRGLGRTVAAAVLFLLIASLCAIPRFGQRENEQTALSDSDFYLDMARFFSGGTPSFRLDFVHIAQHHYNRPLLPLLAGCLGKWFLGGNFRAAFSLVDIMSAALTAGLFYWLLRRWKPGWKLAWLPPVLFLSGFPQLNWGYHILTDTLGLATAFATAALAYRLVERADEPSPVGWRWYAGVALLAVVSAAAFLARETAWLPVASTVFLIGINWRRGRVAWLLNILVLVVVLAGKIPHWFYTQHYQLRGADLTPVWSNMANGYYLADSAVKILVAFNLAWLLAFWAFWRRGQEKTPPLLIGWAVGAVLYMVAGYIHNNLQLVGYPLRLSYALFPLVFFWAGCFFEKVFQLSRRTLTVLIYVAGQVAVNLCGVALDPAKGKVTVLDLLRMLKL